EPVLHQECDVIARGEPERAQQVRALVRALVELAIGDRLARSRHAVRDLVGVRSSVMRWMRHLTPAGYIAGSVKCRTLGPSSILTSSAPSVSNTAGVVGGWPPR